MQNRASSILRHFLWFLRVKWVFLNFRFFTCKSYWSSRMVLTISPLYVQTFRKKMWIDFRLIFISDIYTNVILSLWRTDPSYWYLSGWQKDVFSSFFLFFLTWINDFYRAAKILQMLKTGRGEFFSLLFQKMLLWKVISALVKCEKLYRKLIFFYVDAFKQ